MLRFELELALIQKQVDVADLPEIWNTKMQEYLGITPPDDADGVLQEMKLYTQPWGFSLSEIDTPIDLWHGTADETVPLLHGQTLAERLPVCDVHFIEQEGHFSLPINHAEKILDELVEDGHSR